MTGSQEHSSSPPGSVKEIRNDELREFADKYQLTRDELQSVGLECITACELAKRIGLNRKTVYDYAARGQIPCRRVGRRFVFHLPSVIAWLGASPSENDKPPRGVAKARRNAVAARPPVG